MSKRHSWKRNYTKLGCIIVKIFTKYFRLKLVFECVKGQRWAINNFEVTTQDQVFAWHLLFDEQT